MTELVVRRLLVDLQAPVERHWCGGDAFRTALFNALSMSFPLGEQFFIDAVRNGLNALPQAQQERFRAEVQGFAGQEATHRRLHGLFNAQAQRHGLANEWEARLREQQALLAGADPRHHLAITAANEHFTAILAQWMLHNADVFADSEPRLATLWLWHSAEELEHRSTAFDLYQALGGNHEWRVTWFRRATWLLLAGWVRQTVCNLRRDGTLWRWRTWRSAASFLFGRRGLVRQCYPPWREYFRREFHPDQADASASAEWLQRHRDAYVPVGP